MRGICLTLMEEFGKVLNGEAYSILPLVRPTSSKQEAARQLVKDGEKTLSSHSNLVGNLMRTTASDAPLNSEVMARNALNTTTLNDEGQLALCRPAKRAKIALENAVGTGGQSQKSIDAIALKKLKKPELEAVAANENVLMTKRKPVKEDYIAAILESRYGCSDEDAAETTATTSAAGTTAVTSAAEITASTTKFNGISASESCGCIQFSPIHKGPKF